MNCFPRKIAERLQADKKRATSAASEVGKAMLALKPNKEKAADKIIPEAVWASPYVV